MSIFKDKILLITGGTGSFGNAVLKRFLDSDVGEIRIFSRDEKKQDDMRHRLQNPKVKFYIGDVRDKRSVDSAMSGVDYVFSAAIPVSCSMFRMAADSLPRMSASLEFGNRSPSARAEMARLISAT